MPKLVKITMSVTDQIALKEVLDSVPGISLECGPPRLQDNGTFSVVLYGSESQVATLTASGTVLELDREFGARLAERRKEVGIGDRFNGGTIAPRGLGTAVGR